MFPMQPLLLYCFQNTVLCYCCCYHYENYFHYRAAARNDVDLLKAFAAAGASMTVADYSSKTPLEIVKCSLSSVLCKGINLICCH